MVAQNVGAAATVTLNGWEFLKPALTKRLRFVSGTHKGAQANRLGLIRLPPVPRQRFLGRCPTEPNRFFRVGAAGAAFSLVYFNSGLNSGVTFIMRQFDQ
jgi:hypothetical protein